MHSFSLKYDYDNNFCLMIIVPIVPNCITFSRKELNIPFNTNLLIRNQIKNSL